MSTTAVPMDASGDQGLGRQQSPSATDSTMASKRDGQDKWSREQRLKELMVEFREAAAEGIGVQLIDPESRLVCQAVFRMGSDMNSISLQPALMPESIWDVQDIGSVTKGDAFKSQVPELADLSSSCLGLELDSEIMVRCLHFSDRQHRDDFYACLKIVQMCGESRQPE